MVGGRAAHVVDEVILRFEFPERPGALFNFLNKLGGHWNISMFHYRDRGAAVVGWSPAFPDLPHDERTLVPAALEEIGYPYWDRKRQPGLSAVSRLSGYADGQAIPNSNNGNVNRPESGACRGDGAAVAQRAGAGDLGLARAAQR